jgi:oxygen-dependent protoporphyrinogen oxidase
VIESFLRAIAYNRPKGNTMPGYRILESSFLGTPLSSDTKPIQIIGGGVAGLLTGFYLKQLGRSFTIYETSDRCGGLLGSHRHEYGRSEQAANGLLWCPELQEVCDILQLPVLEPKESAKARYIVRDGALHKMPLRPWELAAAAMRAMIPRTSRVETIEEFGQLYFGNTLTRQVLEPAFTGIYGADIAQLSFPGALTSLAQHMQQSALLPLALVKGRRAQARPKTSQHRVGTHSFEGGMGAFVGRLQEYLRDHIQLETDGFSAIDPDARLILATPAYVSASYFADDTQPGHETIASLLKQVEYTPIVSMTLFVKRSAMAHFRDGFGCLLPRTEGMTILGVLFNSSTFAHRVWDDEHVSLTCIMRDTSPEGALFTMPEDELATLVESELHTLLGLSAPAVERVLYRWPRGIPLYTHELYESWFVLDALLKEHVPHVNLIGNYTGEISIRRMCQEIRKATLGELPLAALPVPKA